MKEGKDNAMMKCYVYKCLSGMSACGVEILAAASKLANHLGIKNFKSINGWLWHFRNCHGLFNVQVCGEAADADTASIK